MQDLSVSELRDLYARLVGPHSDYAYREASDRMREPFTSRDVTTEDVLVALNLRLEIVEETLKGKRSKEA